MDLCFREGILQPQGQCSTRETEVKVTDPESSREGLRPGLGFRTKQGGEEEMNKATISNCESILNVHANAYLPSPLSILNKAKLLTGSYFGPDLIKPSAEAWKCHHVSSLLATFAL